MTMCVKWANSLQMIREKNVRRKLRKAFCMETSESEYSLHEIRIERKEKERDLGRRIMRSTKSCPAWQIENWKSYAMMRNNLELVKRACFTCKCYSYSVVHRSKRLWLQCKNPWYLLGMRLDWVDAWNHKAYQTLP